MKILSLYVENFGRLSAFSMNFDDGMVVLHQPNGWGKSSLAVFIKAMLYGLPASTKRSLIENERKRYTPWQGGAFGGSMDVLLGEKRLRIERRFGEKESMDTLVLTDLDTGVALPTPARLTLGEEWLGVDAAAYERSTYLSQRPIDESDGNLSIHAKLNRLIDATDDIGSFDHAMEILEKQRKYYSLNSGRRGAIADEEARLAELETAYAHCLEQATEAKSSADALERLQKELRENRAESEQLAAKEREQLALREKKAKASHLAQLKELLSREQGELEELLSAVGGSLPTEAQLMQLEQIESEIAAVSLLLQQKEATLDADSPQTQQAALAQYFGEHIPTDEEMVALRGAAVEAQNAAQRWENHQNEAEEPAPTEKSETACAEMDFAKYRRFCMQYPTERAKYEQHRNQAAKEICRAEMLVKDNIRKGKCCAWAAGICAALGVVAALVMLALFPSLLWLPLLAGLVGAVGCGIGRVRTTAAAAGAQKMLAEAQQTLQQAQEKYDALMRQWRSVCHRLEEIGGVQIVDAAQALELISAQETAAQRAVVGREERERARALKAQKGRELAQSAKATQNAWQALWHWGEAPLVQEAPVAVERLAMRLTQYRTLCEDVAAMRQSVREQREHLETLRLSRETLLSPFGQASTQSAAAAWLREMCAKASVATQRVTALKEQVRGFLTQNGEDVEDVQTLALTDEQVAEITAQKQSLDEESERLQRQIALVKQTLQQQSEAAAAMDGVQDEMTACRQGLEQSRAALGVVQETQKYMKQAKDALSGRYLQRMKDSFAAYLAELSGEEDAAFTMDGSFAVKLRRGGASRTKEAFSAGQRDVISLCARLSLVDAMFEEEAPFLVLDDPFANIDDQTTLRARALLDKAAEKYQILYLTCHSSRV